ncbi:MAG: hypothetical protein RIS47_900 [Bacteroidota bacterium]|jgi:NAD(P)H-hydrate epimerase
MKILEASKVREADEYTIMHTPIKSIALMEKAAWQVANWIIEQAYTSRKLVVFAGPGNNGGDGLALARMLADEEWNVTVYMLDSNSPRSENCQTNLLRLEGIDSVKLQILSSGNTLPEIADNVLVVDALFGSGLKRPLGGFAADLVAHINQSGAVVISVDLPSGLFAEDNFSPFPDPLATKPIIAANYTLTFEFPFLSFFFPENERYVGKIITLPIGIHPTYIENVNTQYYTTELSQLKSIFRNRKKFSHKGTFGHALLVVGSYGKMGAAVLATKAALRAGAGLVTAHVPELGYHIMQGVVPEALISIDPNPSHFTQMPNCANYDAIAIGPGLGTDPETCTKLCNYLSTSTQSMVLDADAINILAQAPDQLRTLAPKTILTPHPKEFERLFGSSQGAYQRLEKQQKIAKEHQIIIVLKGAHTTTALPDGSVYFNTTGNPGMATAGSGDVLTGIIVALLAQGYTPESAAILGVYVHGRAGDLARIQHGQTSLIASDIIDNLGKAFLEIETNI